MASNVCCTPAPPAEHIDEGKEVTIGGLKCYVNNPSCIEGPLVRKFVDKIAAAGFYAICPDFLHGEPFVPKDPANPWADLGPWLAVHHPDASVDDAKSVMKDLKAQGVESIGLTGCCWGGRVCAMVGKEDDLAKAIVLLHTSLTTKEIIEDLKVATAYFSPEVDEVISPAAVQEFKEILDAKPFPTLVKIYPGRVHGWTIRYDVNDPDQVKGADEAHTDMMEFYKSVLL